MLPTTVERVPRQTADDVNAEIRRQTSENVARYGSWGDEEIERRLHQLDQEWDIERTLEANAATVALVGLGLGAFVDRRFFALPLSWLVSCAARSAGLVSPRPIFRRLGNPHATGDGARQGNGQLHAGGQFFELFNVIAVQGNSLALPTVRALHSSSPGSRTASKPSTGGRARMSLIVDSSSS